MRDDVSMSAALASDTPLDRFLTSENEVIRSAAVRALPALSPDGAGLRRTLTALLLDPDADVRADAMERLAAVAEHGDGEALLRSLEGDPVREVKLAAISGLSRFRDDRAVELLRALALSRCEDRVAWEDEDSDWEDWLDIQIAAIEALGALGETAAIDDLLAARDDEFGQTLDTAVFRALGGMGQEGARWLLAIINVEGGIAAERALDVLATFSRDALVPYLEPLLAAPDARVRGLAAAFADATDPLLRAMATEDPDPSVRIAALKAMAGAVPDVAVAALGDTDETVQAAALEGLTPEAVPGLVEALEENILAWLATAPPALRRAAAIKAPEFAPLRAETALLDLAEEGDGALEARVAAVKSLGQLDPPASLETLRALLASPAQQVRAAALVLCARAAAAGSEEAGALLAAAIAGTLLSEGEARIDRPPERDAPDAAQPKGEGPGIRQIRITREGEIVDGAAEEGGGSSTLSSILGGAAPAPEMAEDTPEETAPKRRKRRPVEGPDEVAEALVIEAMRCAQGAPGAAIDAALLARIGDEDAALRRTAWEVLAERPGPASASEMIAAGTNDDDPVIRAAAFRIGLRGEGAEALRAKALADADPLIRASGVAALSAEPALAHIGDPARAVRSAALERVLSGEDAGVPARAVATLLDAERADTLGELVARSEPARDAAKATLAAPDVPNRKALILLQAFGGA